MRSVVNAVASTQAHLGRGRFWMLMMIGLLILHFLGSVQGWNNGSNMPNSYCQTPMDCSKEGWTDPLPACEEFRCTCPLGTCVVYTTGVTGYLYFCGPCGMLGSECSDNTDCAVNWQCVNSFCKCDQGTVYRGVCLYYESVPTSINSVVLIFILMLIVILQKLISSRKTLKKLFCKSSSESEDEVSRVVASNPLSNDKTAAFTITNSDFMATAEDPDLAWALELSRREAEHYDIDASTLSSSMSSLPFADPRFTGHSPPAQPGTSGWGQSLNDVGAQRHSSRVSLSSTSSSRYYRSSGTDTSNNSTLPSASLRSSFTSSSRLPSSLIFSYEMSPPALESLRMNFEDDEFEATRI